MVSGCSPGSIIQLLLIISSGVTGWHRVSGVFWGGGQLNCNPAVSHQATKHQLLTSFDTCPGSIITAMAVMYPGHLLSNSCDCVCYCYYHCYCASNIWAPGWANDGPWNDKVTITVRSKMEESEMREAWIVTACAGRRCDLFTLAMKITIFISSHHSSSHILLYLGNLRLSKCWVGFYF